MLSGSVRADLFSEEERYEFLAANPDVLGDGDFIGLLESSPSPIAQSYLDALWQNPQPSTARTQLESFIAWRSNELFDIINKSVWLYQNETPVNFVALRDWLGKKKSFVGEIEIASTWIEESNMAAWQSHINSIPQRVTLSEDESGDLQRYVSLIQTIETAKSAGRTLKNLNAGEVSVLHTIAIQNPHLISQFAKNILTVFYGYTFSDEYGRSPVKNKRASTLDLSKSPLSAYVVNGFVEIPIEAKTEGRLAIFDLQGKLVAEQGFTSGSTLVSFAPKRFRNGSYFYSITGVVSLRNSGMILIQD